jgi:sigma-B regulation protein RsbU (phosphoserine phosphatase)
MRDDPDNCAGMTRRPTIRPPRIWAPLPMEAPTERHDQFQDFLLLQRVAQRIGSILDLDELLEQIVDDVAQTFGYLRSGILFLDAERGDIVIAAVRGWTSHYHVKGDRFTMDEGMIGHVARTGQPYYAPDVTKDPYYMVSETSTRSEVDIPIRSRGRIIGVFNAQHADVDAFPAHRLQLLEALAGHIGVAVENARLFERERHEKERMVRDLAEARAIQSRLFPARAPEMRNLRVTGLSTPCLAVGGDWYDYVPLPDGRMAIVLGDVAGKGPGAALLMTSTRSIVRMHAEQGAGPASVLSQVNDVLVADLPASKFVTMIYAIVDPDHRSVTFASAGHLPPVVAGGSGVRVIRTQPDLPVGIREWSYSEHTVDLDPGDRLFLYTDGVTEARSRTSEEYGEARLLRHAGDPDASAESLLRDVQAHAEGHPAVDDITIVVVEALE